MIDSGCSISASHDRSVFVEYSRYTGRITVEDGGCVNIVGIGKVVIECLVDGAIRPVYIQNAHHISSLTRNLISTNHITQNGSFLMKITNLFLQQSRHGIICI